MNLFECFHLDLMFLWWLQLYDFYLAFESLKTFWKIIRLESSSQTKASGYNLSLTIYDKKWMSFIEPKWNWLFQMLNHHHWMTNPYMSHTYPAVERRAMWLIHGSQLSNIHWTIKKQKHSYINIKLKVTLFHSSLRNNQITICASTDRCPNRKQSGTVIDNKESS